jgi:hypothetical protein
MKNESNLILIEKTPSTPEVEDRQSLKEEKEKAPVDPNNDNSRHWITFPNPRTPQKIIDIKKRLGQLNVPSTLARPSTASNALVQQQETVQPVTRPATASAQHQKQANDDQHHFLTFEKRETPDDLRAARSRIDKYRYNPSLDNYPRRPQTCPDRTDDIPKESENESLLSQPSKPDVWIVDEEKKTTLPNTESFVQVVNCDNLPSEYATALEISNAAQNEYEKNLRMNAGRRPDNIVYRLPAMLPDNRNVSLVSQQSLKKKCSYKVSFLSL